MDYLTLGKIMNIRKGIVYNINYNCIKVSITWNCNIKCINCCTLCDRLPIKAEDQISINQVQTFVDYLVEKDIHFRKIIIEGGEPSWHPELHSILEIIFNYKYKYSPSTEVHFTTNKSNTTLLLTSFIKQRYGKDIFIDNWDLYKDGKQNKQYPLFPYFLPICIAPIDLPGMENVDYSIGCYCMEYGIELSGRGYLPCSVASSINRAFNLGLGLPYIPTPKQSKEILMETCCRCGLFLVGEHRQDLQVNYDIVSPSWAHAIETYKEDNHVT